MGADVVKKRLQMILNSIFGQQVTAGVGISFGKAILAGKQGARRCFIGSHYQGYACTLVVFVFNHIHFHIDIRSR